MTPSLVVLTDFFAVSNRALSYAAGLAVPLQAHLVLLHTRHNELLAPSEFTSHHTRQSELATTYALRQLAAVQSVPTDVDMSEASLPAAVREAVRHHNPLLLVMGRSGSATASAEIVTDTAMDLLRYAPYPLLVVPAAGWDEFPPRRLLLAVDGQPFRLRQHEDTISRLLYALQGTLDIVHVTDDGEVLPYPEAVLNTVRPNDLVDDLTEESLHNVYHTSVAEGVLQEAARQKTDMLVVVARRHSLLGSLFHESTTAQLLQESPIPVLLLPAGD